MRRGRHIWTDFDVAETPLSIAAVHWPSRIVPTGYNGRIEYARALQRRFRRALEIDKAAPVVVMGDFNDEPFDDSLTNHLQGTRDRTAVKRNNDLLYNPFWRLLGENLAFEDDGAACAGSHFWECHAANDWYTFDQALVSSGLLQGVGWTLIESATSILPLEQLRTPARKFRLKFDHLPIAMQLEHR